MTRVDLQQQQAAAEESRGRWVVVDPRFSWSHTFPLRRDGISIRDLDSAPQGTFSSTSFSVSHDHCLSQERSSVAERAANLVSDMSPGLRFRTGLWTQRVPTKGAQAEP